MSEMEPLSLGALEKLSEEKPKPGSVSARQSSSSSSSSSAPNSSRKKSGKLKFIKSKVVGTTQLLSGKTASEARLDLQAAMMEKSSPGQHSLKEEDFRSALQSPKPAHRESDEFSGERKRNPLGRAISRRFGEKKKEDRSSSAAAPLSDESEAPGDGRRKSTLGIGSRKEGREEKKEKREKREGDARPASFSPAHENFLPVVLDDDSQLHASLQKDSDSDGSWGSSRSVSASASASGEDLRLGPETPSVRRAKFLQKYTQMQSGVIRPPSQAAAQAGQGEESDGDGVDFEDDPIADRVSGTNKKFHRRFKDLSQETVNENFLCALLLKGGLLSQGSMYITTNYVCFYSNIIAKKTRVAIRFTDILSVRKCKILRSIPNSIEIHTPFKKYFWASFLHRDVAYDLINRRWRTVRKKMGQPVIDEVADPDEEIETEDIDLQFSDDEDEEEIRGILEGDEELVPSVRPPTSVECSHSFDDREATRTRYTEIFPITVEEFYQHFLSNRGDRFWKEFHSKDGYHDFSVSPWVTSPEGCCLERHTEFRAPINMSFARKFTRVTQQQRCRFLSKDALVFSSSSHSRDVPYSNQFLVNAKWKVVNTRLGYCKLTVVVHVMFTRKNWLRSMIERNAIEGSREWFENWIKTALKVAKLIKQDAAKPLEERRPKIDMLRQSMRLQDNEGLRHFNKLRNSRGRGRKRSNTIKGAPCVDEGEETESDEEVEEKQSWAQEGLKVWHVLEEAASQHSSRAVVSTIALAAFLLMLTFCFCCYWFVSALQEEVAGLEEQNLRLQEQATFLESVLGFATKSTPGAAELVGSHSEFWRSRGQLEVQLAQWKDVTSSIEAAAQQLQASLRSFAVPRASTDAEFIAAVTNALAGNVAANDGLTAGLSEALGDSPAEDLGEGLLEGL